MILLKLLAKVVVIVAASLVLSLPVCAAQATKVQLKTCEKYDEALRCNGLATEYAQKNFKVTSTPVNGLDRPWATLNIFIGNIALKAFLRTEADAAMSQAKKDAQEAIQSMAQLVSIKAATTQVGSSPTTSGSTNLVTKPTTTDFISIAAETGAFTDTLNGSTATLQANALGLSKYFAHQPVFERWNLAHADLLEPLEITATLNVATQSSSTATPTTGSANSITPSSIESVLVPSNNASLSSIGATYAIYRRYNPQSQAFQTSWKSALAAGAQNLAATGAEINAAVVALLSVPTVPPCFIAAQAKWAGPTKPLASAEDVSFDSFVNVYSQFESDANDCILDSADAASVALTLNTALQSFQNERNQIFNQARGTPLATLGYTYSTPVQTPATHDVTAVMSYLFRNGAQLTGNFTASIYASLPSGANYTRLKDLQASAELDKPFGGTTTAPLGTFSIAGYGQYQYDPTVLNITAGNLVPGTTISLPSNAQVLLGTAGWLGVVQGKVVFNLGKGLNIPIAVKWSNKTDLLAGNETRGQVGLSYDLSALSSLISGKQ